MVDFRFNEQDKNFMSVAIKEAEQAFDSGGYPVGAVLTVNGTFIGKCGSTTITEDFTEHAAFRLLLQNGVLLRQVIKKSSGKYNICLYLTLEPCLMCMGATILHHVTRIVVACPNPHMGATGINLSQIGSFYSKHLPKIETGLMKKESFKLLSEFFKTGKFDSQEKILKEFVDSQNVKNEENINKIADIIRKNCIVPF